MRKLKKWPPFRKYRLYRKISNYQSPTKVWVSSFLSVNRNGISASAIMKKIEKWSPFCKYWSYGKMSNYWPPKVWVSNFWSVNRNGILGSAIMNKSKNDCHFININCTEKFRITDPPKVWVSSFPSVGRNGISVSAIMKKFKNGCHFININHTEKFQFTDPPKSLGLRFSECQQKQNIRVSHYGKIEKWPPFRKYQSFGSPFNPTSHLCVALDYLIFVTFMWSESPGINIRFFDLSHSWTVTVQSHLWFTQLLRFRELFIAL